jgi:hypothetical protein
MMIIENDGGGDLGLNEYLNAAPLKLRKTTRRKRAPKPSQEVARPLVVTC